MKFFFCALVLSFMLFLHEIEASDNFLRGILFQRMRNDKDRNKDRNRPDQTGLATSRLTMPPPREPSTSRNHDALDLYQHQPATQQPRRQKPSKRVTDRENQIKAKYDRSSQDSSSTRSTLNDEFQQQERSERPRRRNTPQEATVIQQEVDRSQERGLGQVDGNMEYGAALGLFNMHQSHPQPVSHPYGDFEPQLLYNNNSGLNPYLENAGQNSNQYPRNHDPNLSNQGGYPTENDGSHNPHSFANYYSNSHFQWNNNNYRDG